MNKFIINEDAIMKNVLISDVDIKLTDENYGSLEAFTDKLNNGTKGKFDTEYQIAYEVFFGTDVDPTVSSGTTSEVTLDVTVAAGNIYFWRVVSTDTQGNTSQSEIFEFQVSS